MAGIYAVFALGLNVHWGYTGLFNIGIAGFFALGAYTAALLTSPAADPLLFEEFVFAGDWAQLGVSRSRDRPVVRAGAGGGRGGVRRRRARHRLRDAAPERRLSGHRHAGHRRERPALLSQREVGRQRIEGPLPDPPVPGGMAAVRQIQLPLHGGRHRRAGRVVHPGAAGHEVALGPGAASHPRRRGRRRGQRQGRLPVQVAGVRRWGPSSWASAGRSSRTTSALCRR